MSPEQGPDGTGEAARSVAEELVAGARDAGRTLAVAESLTAGLVVARVADVSGASVVLRGGVVAYATALKTELLGVPADLLRRHGPVHPDVALAMAEGVRARLGADVGVATTGVAGPGPQDGHAAGTAFVAAVGPAGRTVVSLHEPGDRQQVRARVTDVALAVAARALVDPVAGASVAPTPSVATADDASPEHPSEPAR